MIHSDRYKLEFLDAYVMCVDLQLLIYVSHPQRQHKYNLGIELLQHRYKEHNSSVFHAESSLYHGQPLVSTHIQIYVLDKINVLRATVADIIHEVNDIVRQHCILLKDIALLEDIVA